MRPSRLAETKTTTKSTFVQTFYWQLNIKNQSYSNNSNTPITTEKEHVDMPCSHDISQLPELMRKPECTIRQPAHYELRDSVSCQGYTCCVLHIWAKEGSLVGRNDIFSLDIWTLKETGPELERSLFFYLIHMTQMLS